MNSTMNEKRYKDLSLKEFTKAAEVYESDRAGVYKMCRKDYPDVLAELEKEPFDDLLDCGCGTAPMLTLSDMLKKQTVCQLYFRRALCIFIKLMIGKPLTSKTICAIILLRPFLIF